MRGPGIRTAALTAVLGGVATLAAACGGDGAVAFPTPHLSDSDSAACRQFLDALPATVAHQKPRTVTPGDALGRAYGDPAITVTCGVGVPATYSSDSSCETFDGVGWYVPDSAYVSNPDDRSVTAVLTAVGYRPIVQLVVPGDYRPDGPFLAIGELSGAVKHHLRLVRRCTG